MSESATSNENVVQQVLMNHDDEGTGPGSSQVHDISPAAGGVEAVSENEKSPPIQAAVPNEQKTHSEKGSSETLLQLELLRILTRGFPENEPKPTPSEDKEIKALRRKLFGLTKTESGVNNRFDYEQKYPEDRPGEELGHNARVWSTYLDEAETYDRERVEGWKDTADVLLVFAGLFSGVITTFLSQASQSLQRDNTQVSAFLLSEIAQLLRAQSSGTPINNIPNSTLTPTSPFTPSTNAFLVNGLWFTSLAITLCTALFAVLSKQWLYYYLSSISGTPLEKAKARQFRFQGFELWKVGAIIDLLPILLHLAVGVFLAGIIVLLFPLDVRVAWTIVAIAGITFVLYFVSVILPIRYPGCPYTTSLTIYLGVLFFFLPNIFHWISAVSKKALHPETSSKKDPQPGPDMIPGKASLREVPKASSKWEFFRGKINSLFHPIRGFLRYSYVPVQRAFSALNELVDDIVQPMLTAFRSFVSAIPKFTNWREENIKKAVKSATALDLKALQWLYETSSATSVHRIIARCAFMHRNVSQKFNVDVLDNFWRILEVNETNVVDLHHGLCADLLSRECNYWDKILPSTPNVEFKRQLDKAEYQIYPRIADKVIHLNYDQILKDAIQDDTLKLPVAMWQCFFARASGDDTLAAQILTFESNLFIWTFDPTPDSTPSTDPVSLQTILKDVGESTKWQFDYLFRYFHHDSLDYSSEGKSFETRYLLFVSVYRNLTSDQPLITDKEQRQQSLYNLFDNFGFWVYLYKPQHVSPKQYFAFFIDICSVDEFWSESMTDDSRWASVVWCLDRIWDLVDSDVANQFPFTECHDLTLIYQWCSRDHLDPQYSWHTTPIFTLLVMPQNRNSLCTILLNDPNAVSNLSKCFQNFRVLRNDVTYLNLIDLLKSVNPGVPLFTILYNSSVLVQLWVLFVVKEWDAKKFSPIVKSKLDQKRLNELYAAMNEQAQLEAQFVKGSGSDDGALMALFWDWTIAALAASAREFGQSIGMTSQLQQSVENQSTEEKNLDSEERAQPREPNENEHQNNSIVHRMRKVFPFGPR